MAPVKARPYTPLSGEPVGYRDGVGGGWGPYMPVQGPRRWLSAWGNCCGECDGLGWGVCCATFWCFPCVFGYIKYKVFDNIAKAIAWAVLVAVILAAYASFSAANGDNDYPFKFHNHTSNATDSDFSFPDGTDAEEEFATDGRSISSYIPFVLLLLLAIVGGYNRIQMRKKFGIVQKKTCGGEMDDVCLWFWCHGCALCQEARTIFYNNVEKGEWRGPEGMAIMPVPSSAAPPVQYIEPSIPSV